MSIIPVGLLAGAITPLAGAVGGGGGFEAALSQAASAFGLGGGGGGMDAQLEQKLIQGAVGVMGGMMMNLAGQVLNEGLEDDGE